MKTTTHKSIIKNLCAYALAFLLVLSNFTSLIQADGVDPNVDPSTPAVEETKDPVEETSEDEKAGDEIPDDQTKPLEDENSENAEEEKTIEENTDESENDGLEISDENVAEALRGEKEIDPKLTIPTINPVAIGDKEVTGNGLVGANRRKRANGPCKIHVTVTDVEGNEVETKTFSIEKGKNPKKGEPQWSVTLANAVQKGYKIVAQQELDGKFSNESDPYIVKELLADQHKDDITMPTGEIWIEQTSSNQVNDDEQAEAVQLLKDANTAIAGDIKSVVFSIDGTRHAYYEVTYTDDSTSGKIEAPNLKIKQVTETSRGAKLNDITIVDNVIKGKLEGNGPFDNIKVQIVLKLSEASKGTFCNDKGCTVDKDSSKAVDAVVDTTTGEFSYTIKSTDKIELGNVAGVSVKEPHKFKSCSQTTVIAPTPKKTEVKDPRKLTSEDKKAIDAAIREAYTVNGVSKLPNGTGFNEGAPAVIQIDDSGNVKIFSGNDVVVNEWDDNGKAIPKKNEDGSYKLKDGAQPTATIPAKDLVKNIKPEKPTVALSEDKKSITITPNEKDTDANSISVSYTGKDNSTKTTTATKDENGTWSISEGEGSVDANGVITFEVSNVKGGTTVTATVTDKGGIADDDKEALTSDQAEFKITKAILVEALGGLDPVDMKKWVDDQVDWKDGVKAKDSATEENKAKIKEFLDEAKTTFADENSRGTTAEGDFTGKIKVTFDDGSFIEVDKQNLYVSNHVTSVERKDKVPTDAVDVEFKLGEGTKVDNTGSGAIEGNKDNPTSYSKYKVKPNTNLKDYKLPNLNASVIDSIKVTPQDGYVDPVWKDSTGGTNFVATTTNNVFTATATKAFIVKVVPNGGTGDEISKTVKKDGTYNLPAANTFTPPNENQEFSGWQVGEDSQNLKKAGDQITITDNVTIKAIWKPIELKVNFLPGTGASGEMKDAPVNKGSDYKLPEPTFTPPTNQEFAGWKVGNEDGVKQANEKITITDNVTLTATWRDIKVKVTYNANGGSKTMAEAELTKGSKYTILPNGFTAPDDTQEFKTWEIDGKEVAPGTEITVDKDTVVKALWKKIKVNVSYNANGGSGEMTGGEVDKGSNYTVLPNAFTAPDDTQEFKAWEVDGKEVAPGAEITIKDNTVIKAIWKKIEVTVTYAANGGTGTMETKTLDKGSKYTLLTNGFTAPENQEFNGWKIGDTEYAEGSEITVNADTTVEAQWKDIIVDVTFDGNGGSGSMNKATVKKGGEYTLPANEFTAPDDTQEFAGWQVGDDANNLKQANEKITIKGDTVIKAIWKKIEVTVTYAANGGTGTMETKTLDKGSKYTLLTNGFTAPENQEFNGWKIGDTEYAEGSEITVNADTTVEAQWKDIIVDVTFDGNGGSGSMNKATVKKGGEYTLPANEFTAPDGTQEFDAWEVNGEKVAPGTKIKVDKDTVIKALWKDIEYKVTFNGNTGTGSMDPATVKKGEKYKLPDNGFGAPSDKQEFKTWEVDGKEVAPGTEITISGNTEVKAVWKNKPAEPKPEPNPGYYNPTPNPKPNKPDNKKDEPKKPDTPTPSQPGPGKEELPVTPKPGGEQEVTPDPKKTDEIEVTVTPEGGKPTKVDVKKDKDGKWISSKPDIVQVDPKTGKITIAKGAKDVRAIATLKLERGFHERYLYGYVDGTVRPEGFITRCEAAALIARLANLDMTNADKPNFPDTPSAWYNTAINAVVAKNLMFADANGNFRPQEPITRGEFARALYYIDRQNNDIAPFEDIKGHVYEAAINQAYGNGLINGYLDGTFKPDAFIQRSEATKILNKYANRGVDHDGLSLVRHDLIHFTDIDESHWAYYEIMEAANTHEYERVVSTLYETWLKIVYDTKMK